MRWILVLCALAGLALTVVPSFLVMGEWILWETHSRLMLLGMILWFAAAPFWIGKER